MKLRNTALLFLSVLLLFSLFGCSRFESFQNAIEESAPESPDYIVKEDGSSAEFESSTADREESSRLPENRKLIQTVSMQVETEDLDVVLEQVESKLADLGGYTENSNVQNGSAHSGKRYRTAEITLRIPAADLDSFLDKIGEITNIVSSRKSVDDVTLNYVATESRMKALQTEESRLLELMEKAETLDDLLTVEERLTDVRTELEEVTSALRVLDNQVDYATIHLTVSEVKEYTDTVEPETVWERIGAGFVESLKGIGAFFVELFVFLVVAAPYLALLALVALGVLWIVRRAGKKKAAKQPAKQEANKEN